MNRAYWLGIMLCTSSLLFGCTSDEDKHIPGGEDNGPVLITKYQAIALTPQAFGSYTLNGNDIQMELYGTNSMYGVCPPVLATDHFMAEATCTSASAGYGLAIVQEKDGKPDYDNFTSISVTLQNGIPFVKVADRQNKVENVLDNTNTIKKDDLSKRYSINLSGTQFSVPFTQINGKVKIIRNQISGFFHFYMGVKKEIEGVVSEDWIELAQSKDWSSKNQRFFACPIAVTGNKDQSLITFKDVKLSTFSPQDISDASTGFKASNREYTWAGFKGNAVVVSFGKETPFSVEDRKFVFWSEANYVPAWHMNNELMFCYEFVEVWSNKGIPGCFEPMSDRLLRYSKVDIIEDNPVRKVIHWHYVLVNPDYKLPASGSELPEVDEYYTIYPDATGVRNIIFRQKTDGGFESRHELGEPMVISGSSTVPADHFDAPALVISNLSGGRYSLLPARDFDANAVRNWTEQLYVARLKNAPNVFCGFSFNPQHPETAPLPVTPEFTWHNTIYEMSHFPVDKQPYITDSDKSIATFPSQVSHSSIIGIEAFDGTDWNGNYQVDKNGRKYRQYISLLGINDKSNTDGEKKYMQTWLDPGVITIQTPGIEYKGILFAEKAIRIDCKNGKTCIFELQPAQVLKNPVFKLENWRGTKNAIVKINDVVMQNSTDYVCDVIDNNLVIWLNREVNAKIKISVEN